ncbi:glycosyltransferase family 2 protein [Clostridium perfringens]|nr:glycosyltransferase family 2 protein [Clostridium perfringens]EHK2442951.1 glycosyltransferase family 2 protein [Clostridium perfringens]
MVYIIIVNYNGSDDTIECINSLLKITYKKFKIVVVDNNSRKSELEKIKNLDKEFTLISLNNNLGFAKANNIGIKYAIKQGADYCLLLNNDTTVDENFLGILVESLKKNSKAGIATGLILNYYNHNEKWYDGAKINWNKFEGENLSKCMNNKGEIDVDMISGCLMLIKRELFMKNIFLPEDYFMFFEDLDYCANVKEKGYRLIYNNKSIIYHKISQSSGGEKSPFYFNYSTRNWYIFMNKYIYKADNPRKSKLYFYLNRISRVVYFGVLGKSDKSKAIINGIKEGYKFYKNKEKI